MNDTGKLIINQELISQIKFDEKGLIPAIAQDEKTGEILMVAYANEESLRKTFETSGNTLKVSGILIDCDCDTMILKVTPAGPACHTGERTCFYRTLATRKED
jgi:phosphoribosyl-ATP pyrophosphohydrolase/phosphoribosyl-AMP cyclohydrolase